MTKNERRLLVGCGALSLIGLTAAGSLLAAVLVFPSLGGSGLGATAAGAPEALRSAAVRASGGVSAGDAAVEEPTVLRGDAASDGGESVGAGLPFAAVPSGPAPDLAALYARVGPGVVSIRVTKTGGLVAGQASGSGWVYDSRHIITNNHVVADGSNVRIRFPDRTEVPGDVIGADQDSDLAVIRLDDMPASARALPLIKDIHRLRVGEPVVAIGNPFGNENTITAGIISALGRAIPARTLAASGPRYQIPETIQTDAAINPGNSGGPLLDMRGEVVGINAQISTNGVAANSGVGFAIPASIVARVVPKLIAEGSYEWSYLGVSGTSLDYDLARANDLDTTQGAYILDVLPDGPSREALEGSTTGVVPRGSAPQGLPRGGDVVVAIDGQPVRSFDDLLTYVALETRPGDTISLTVLRGGQEVAVEVTVGVRPRQ